MLYFKSINDAWSYYAKLLLSNHSEEVNGTFELTNVAFTIEDPSENILSIRENFSLSYYLGEMIWYGAGSNDTSFISKYGKIWEKLSDDLYTNNSAYGYIIKTKHHFNQMDLVYDILSEDPTSRRAVININVPDGKAKITKDEQCTIALQFMIRKNKLIMTTMMRSNDIWTGTPYDIFYFTTLQQALAKRLKIEAGEYSHFATSLHMYIRDSENVTNSLLNREDGFEVNYKIDGVKLLEMSSQLYDMIKAYKTGTTKEVRDLTIGLCKQFGIVTEEK